MKKQAYIKPAMRVVPIRMQSHLLTVSNVSNPEGINWNPGGFNNGDDDY